MIFARNAKGGCYTGFYKNLPEKNTFDYEEWLKANALPGPESKVLCIIQDKSGNGKGEVFEYIKDEAFGHIPGFNYQNIPIEQIPKPK